MKKPEIRDRRAGSSGGGGTITLRPRVPEDDALIVEIHNAQEADSVPLTVARWRAEHAEHGETWVALLGDHLPGFGRFHPAWWTGDAGVYAIDLRVDRRYGHQGIGTRLFDLLRSRVLARGATRLVGWVREDAASSRRFAERHSFREIGQILQEYRLHLPDATMEGQVELEDRLRRSGLRITSLAEHGGEDEAFLRALQRLWADSSEDAPDPDALADSFSTWRQEVLQATGLSPETHWIALDGQRPVGMTFLKRLSADSAENDYTGVASTHRGRGIAPALKLRAIAWAQQQGVSWFYTSSEIGNTRMIGINTRLGYRPGVRRLEIACDLAGFVETRLVASSDA